ncbi:MAG: cysteine synthase A [Candidatus Heimdallarchaeota archaeon]
MHIANDITELIGKTPLIRLGRLFPKATVFAKCEFMNPMSVKDRAILQIFEDAEKEGELKPGDTVIECTSGNTGIAVSFISAVKGYKAILVMSEIQSVERRQIMRAFGAEIILTPAELGTKGAREKLKELLTSHPDYFYVGQHVRPSNPKAHYLTTGPEIWQDVEGNIDVLIAGLGTGGTICGAGRYLKEQKASVKLIAIEPAQAPYISKGIFKPHRIMGTAPGFVPETLERDLIDEIFLVEEEEAFAMCRHLAVKEGLLVGISSGAVCHAAERLLKREEFKGKSLVVILADSGQRYLSVKGLFKDY